MGKWSELSLKDKSELMKVFLEGGVSSLSDMKKLYEDGGDKDSKKKSNWFTRMSMTSLANEPTSAPVFTASGYEVQPNGTLTQDPENEGAQKLASNLAVLSAAGNIANGLSMSYAAPGAFGSMLAKTDPGYWFSKAGFPGVGAAVDSSIALSGGVSGAKGVANGIKKGDSGKAALGMLDVGLSLPSIRTTGKLIKRFTPKGYNGSVWAGLKEVGKSFKSLKPRHGNIPYAEQQLYTGIDATNDYYQKLYEQGRIAGSNGLSYTSPEYKPNIQVRPYKSLGDVITGALDGEMAYSRGNNVYYSRYNPVNLINDTYTAYTSGYRNVASNRIGIGAHEGTHVVYGTRQGMPQISVMGKKYYVPSADNQFSAAYRKGYSKPQDGNWGYSPEEWIAERNSQIAQGKSREEIIKYLTERFPDQTTPASELLDLSAGYSYGGYRR